MSFYGPKSKLKLVLLKRLPGQIVFYLGLQIGDGASGGARDHILNWKGEGPPPDDERWV